MGRRKFLRRKSNKHSDILTSINKQNNQTNEAKNETVKKNI